MTLQYVGLIFVVEDNGCATYLSYDLLKLRGCIKQVT